MNASFGLCSHIDFPNILRLKDLFHQFSLYSNLVPYFQCIETSIFFGGSIYIMGLHDSL